MLYRNVHDAKVMGVCAGVADYFGTDPWLVRVGVIIGFFAFTVPTLGAYLLAWWLLDPTPEDLYHNPQEERFWCRVRTQPSETAHALRLRFRDLDRRMQGIEAYVTSREFELNRDIREL